MRLVGPVIEHRPVDELRTALESVAAMRIGAEPNYREQLAGVLAAICWVLGENTDAPISNKGIYLPTWPEASAEADLADDAARGDYPLPDGAGREFANGVWIGISWAYGEICEAPVPLA